MTDAFAAYVADLAERGKSPARAQDAWKRLERPFGNLRPDQVGRAESRLYVAARRADGVSDGTTRTELSHLRAALRYHDKRTPAIVELPTAPDARDRYLTRQEYAKLRDAAASDHIRLFIVLALATAARKSAILALTWDRIDFASSRIDLGRGVGNKRRGVKPMTPEARKALEVAYPGRTCDHVIEYAGEPVASIDRAFRRTVERAGIPKCGPHDIRRSAGRWMAEDGVPMAEIAAYLDHTNLATTMKHYARFSPDYLAGAARSLEVG